MFIRAWGKSENVGRDDVDVEQYVAIHTIVRFYGHSGFEAQNGDISTRYIIATGADRFYVTEETFEYLKSLRSVENRTSAEGKPEKGSISLQYPEHRGF